MPWSSVLFDDSARKNVGMDRLRGVSDCIENLPMDVIRFLRTVVVCGLAPAAPASDRSHLATVRAEPENNPARFWLQIYALLEPADWPSTEDEEDHRLLLS